jgi:hypothetical protein
VCVPLLCVRCLLLLLAVGFGSLRRSALGQTETKGRRTQRRTHAEATPKAKTHAHTARTHTKNGGDNSAMVVVKAAGLFDSLRKRTTPSKSGVWPVRRWLLLRFLLVLLDVAHDFADSTIVGARAGSLLRKHCAFGRQWARFRCASGSKRRNRRSGRRSARGRRDSRS